MQAPQKQKPPKVHIPDGVGPTGPVKDLAEAYMKAYIAIPELLVDLIETLGDCSDSLAVIAIAEKKRAIREGTLSEEDFDEPVDGDQKYEQSDD